MNYIQHYNDLNTLGPLGFKKPKPDSNESDPTVDLDQFIGLIASMLLGLLEGSDNSLTLDKMV